MRCGGDWAGCKCSLVISEKTFAEFLAQYGESEDNIYEVPETMTGISCFDCVKQMTFNCHALVDYVHDVLQDYQTDLALFPKIKKCENFVSEYGG
jgi:5'-3' exonuclease